MSDKYGLFDISIRSSSVSPGRSFENATQPLVCTGVVYSLVDWSQNL